MTTARFVAPGPLSVTDIAGPAEDDRYADGPLTPEHRRIAALQRGPGRAGLDGPQQALLADLHDRSEPGEEILRLLTRPFSRRLEIPDYYRYTCMHVYQWFIGDDPADGLPSGLLALYVTLRDLQDVERVAWPIDLRPPHVTDRIILLDDVLERLREVPARRFPAATVGDLLDRSVTDHALRDRLTLLAECTRFARSDVPEEYVFLRVVQSCECLFSLVRQNAQDVLRTWRDDPVTAAWHLDRGADCAGLLSDALDVLRTMSPAGFMSFRDATGDASAVQSLNYHAMDITVYGHDSRKSAVYESLPHLAELNTPQVREHRPLATVFADVTEPDLAERWHRFSRRLDRWRGAHYRFARTYLPADMKASGGTEGAAYVKKFTKRVVKQMPPAVDGERPGILNRFASF